MGREATIDKFLKEMSMMRSGVMKYEFKYRVPYYILKSMSNGQNKRRLFLTIVKTGQNLTTHFTMESLILAQDER
jgi:hypothetical protein